MPYEMCWCTKALSSVIRLDWGNTFFNLFYREDSSRNFTIYV